MAILDTNIPKGEIKIFVPLLRTGNEEAALKRKRDDGPFSWISRP